MEVCLSIRVEGEERRGRKDVIVIALVLSWDGEQEV
jgi:hypothetical protein